MSCILCILLEHTQRNKCLVSLMYSVSKNLYDFDSWHEWDLPRKVPAVALHCLFSCLVVNGHKNLLCSCRNPGRSVSLCCLKPSGAHICWSITGVRTSGRKRRGSSTSLSMSSNRRAVWHSYPLHSLPLTGLCQAPVSCEWLCHFLPGSQWFTAPQTSETGGSGSTKPSNAPPTVCSTSMPMTETITSSDSWSKCEAA